MGCHGKSHHPSDADEDLSHAPPRLQAAQRIAVKIGAQQKTAERIDHRADDAEHENDGADLCDKAEHVDVVPPRSSPIDFVSGLFVLCHGASCVS